MDDRRDFEWDDAKAAANLARHGVPFESATLVFLDPDLIVVDATRAVDGEVRERALGRIDGIVMSVVFTVRGPSTRLISARSASRAEREIFHGDRALPT